MGDNAVSVRAGFGVRAAAYIVDRLILALALCVVRVPAWIASLFGAEAKNVLFRYSGTDILCYVLAAAYLVLLTYFTGGTLGKKLFHLRVEKADGGRPRLIDVLYRETVGRFLSGILCIGYLMALVDQEKRAFHDWLCGTRVVYDEKLFAPDPDPAPWTIPSQYTIPGAGRETPGEADAPDGEEKETT